MKAEYPRHLTIRLSLEAREGLKKLADAQELSVSDVLRKLIEDRLGE